MGLGNNHFLAEGVSAELMSSVNVWRPGYLLITMTYPRLLVQPRLAKSGEIPHRMWGAKWAERQGIELANIPIRR
jgi:hypothetical protein